MGSWPPLEALGKYSTPLQYERLPNKQVADNMTIIHLVPGMIIGVFVKYASRGNAAYDTGISDKHTRPHMTYPEKLRCHCYAFSSIQVMKRHPANNHNMKIAMVSDGPTHVYAISLALKPTFYLPLPTAIILVPLTTHCTSRVLQGLSNPTF